jgi:hypothetical protein
MERQLEPNAGHRFFVVTLTTYGGKSGEQTVFEKFSVVCVVLESEHFKNPKTGQIRSSPRYVYTALHYASSVF